jgi:Flp pilus assembly protein TadB
MRPNDDLPRSTHPFRDSAIIYACLAIVIVVVATLTGGGFAKALGIAAAFFVGATAWSWWRVRRRLQEEPGE